MPLTVGELAAVLSLDGGPFQRGMRNIDSSVSGLDKRMVEVGHKLSLALTAPLLAGGAAGIKLAGDFETTFSQMQAWLASRPRRSRG